MKPICLVRQAQKLPTPHTVETSIKLAQNHSQNQNRMESQMENLMDNVNCVSYPRTGKRGVPQQFPRRLYNMLEAESNLQPTDNQCLIAWSSTGKAFRIEDVNLFSTLVLPKYFRTSKFSSFQRNLNLVSLTTKRLRSISLLWCVILPSTSGVIVYLSL